MLPKIEWDYFASQALCEGWCIAKTTGKFIDNLVEFQTFSIV